MEPAAIGSPVRYAAAAATWRCQITAIPLRANAANRVHCGKTEGVDGVGVPCIRVVVGQIEVVLALHIERGVAQRIGGLKSKLSIFLQCGRNYLTKLFGRMFERCRFVLKYRDDIQNAVIA